jgi:hypothetical protein
LKAGRDVRIMICAAKQCIAKRTGQELQFGVL